MRNKIGSFLLNLYKKITKCEPCFLYRRAKGTYKKPGDGFKNDCPFCKGKFNFKKDYNNFYVIDNAFPYPNTKEHLMIVPKRHLISIKDFTEEEKLEWSNIFGEYLNQGYFIFNREFGKHPDSSVEHFHTQVVSEKAI